MGLVDRQEERNSRRSCQEMGTWRLMTSRDLVSPGKFQVCLAELVSNAGPWNPPQCTDPGSMGIGGPSFISRKFPGGTSPGVSRSCCQIHTMTVFPRAAHHEESNVQEGLEQTQALGLP